MEIEKTSTAHLLIEVADRLDWVMKVHPTLSAKTRKEKEVKAMFDHYSIGEACSVDEADMIAFLLEDYVQTKVRRVNR